MTWSTCEEHTVIVKLYVKNQWELKVHVYWLLTTAQTYHSVEVDSEIHVVIMEKGIGVLVLSHRQGEGEG